uniref:Uncharacterized protein n=1 Tax=viral metagenome TaxID=1070528 RepID=A0A6C0EE05_9ZZZZ
MKCFILPLFLAFLSTFGVNAQSNIIKPKLCVNCKFFMKESFLTPDAYSKCTKFSFIDHDDFFVNGIKRPETKRYYYCSTARNFDHMCGIEGKKFEEKNKN